MPDPERNQQSYDEAGPKDTACPTKMGGDRLCGRPIYNAPPGIDKTPVCLMHSRDPNKDDAAFQAEFKRILEAAGKGIADFTRFVFPSANYSGRKFAAECRFVEATFTQGADFGLATFTQAADFSQAEFAEAANFSGVKFAGDAKFVLTVFKKDATFTWAAFSADSVFSAAGFCQEALFSATAFAGAAGFHEAQFRERVVFFQAEFGRSTDFSEASFGSHAEFGECTFDENANFSRARFSEGCEFAGAVFLDRSQFDSVIFMKEAGFNEVTFLGEAGFVLSRFEGTAEFARATFEEDVNFSLGRFSQAANYSEAQFLRSAIFSVTEFCGPVRFRKTVFREDKGAEPGPLFVDAHFEKPEAVVFYRVYLGQALFYGCKISDFDLWRVGWRRRSSNGKLMLFEEVVNLEHHGAAGLKPEDGAPEDRDWGLIGDLYHQLKKTYDDRGDYWTAGDFHYGEMEMKRLACPRLTWLAWLEARLSGKPGLRKLGEWCGKLQAKPWLLSKVRSWHQRFGLAAWYRRASDYGESWGKPLLWLGVILLVFAALYPLVGLKVAASKAPPLSATSIQIQTSSPPAADLRYWNHEHPVSLFWHSVMTSLGVAAFQRDLAYEPSYP